MIILCGKSGSGKDLSREILIKYNMIPSISYTSRPIRENEINGIDYNFITRDKFLTKIDQEFFFEYRAYETLVDNKKDLWYYGTSNNDILSENMVVVKDFEGAFKIKEERSLNGLETIIIYLFVDDEIRKQRAKLRGSFNEIEWNRRLKADEIDFPEELINQCNYIIDNTNLTIKELQNKLLKIKG